MISLSNYEEWFILLMDDELNAEQKTMVENFLLLHPHLQEELDLLLSTKLPAENIGFSGKEALQAAAMKLNVVDESLLLYLDNELSGNDKIKVQEQLSSSPDYRLQYDQLQRAKLDAAEIISYPNKKELYRHTEKVILLPFWLRIAVAVVVVLFGGYLFLFNPGNKPAVPDLVAKENKPVEVQKVPVATGSKPIEAPLQQENLVARAVTNKKAERIEKRPAETLPVKETASRQPAVTEPKEETAALQKVDAVQLEISKLKSNSPTTVNNSIAIFAVTSSKVTALNSIEDPEEPAVTDGDDKPKRTPAKGFLRKVSRFIERRTGIGTVNADNELLVGAVALKLN